MSRYPDLMRPLVDLDDVPIERESVGAMGLGSPVEGFAFKPYFYRGTGEDTIEKAAQEAALREERKRRNREANVRAEAKRRREILAEQRRRDRAKRAAEIAEMQARNAKAHRQWLEKYWSEQDEIEFQAEEAEIKRKREARRVAQKQNWRPARPSPGWEPPTGDDIDSWMEDYLD